MKNSTEQSTSKQTAIHIGRIAENNLANLARESVKRFAIAVSQGQPTHPHYRLSVALLRAKREIVDAITELEGAP